MTLEELGAKINAAADRKAYDEPYSDKNFNPITPEQLLEHTRELERETGQQTILRRGGRPERAA